ncbi:S-methyl-5-thioribose-1-phosphate isomerase [Synechococcus sp. PCC 6312]|uniref:S-methyl-5-thioribose-1-phosphate isomerase n=1 Tax=Synechococcus sp. (strain ATCC 27167 / PCC 6312) TaxID=195253 RepID=UPI00029ED76C|nr:S-methyl-5-thioribose-1-phosphate isomerase [Synechococcus sp. PCC 6312]AFY61335.1 methylthioribose-1-phosphate isomerase [Synechococcus sp. PCC 6312]
MSQGIFPVQWHENSVRLIDQTRLPAEYSVVDIHCVDDMATAITTMIVRGAPAIGVAAAFGMYLGARDYADSDRQGLLDHLEQVAILLRQTRPTAVNLFWAIDQMLKAAQARPGSVSEIQAYLLQTAQKICDDDIRTCQQIGDHGLAALPNSPEKLRILTHCNAGALATAGYGTALGVIRSAWSAGRLERVYADETRPRWQGAKLTTWECVQEGIPVTLLADTMAAHCMQQGMIDAVVVGADRIAANGDTANKIGTYSVALAAQAHGIPFFIAAPASTVDLALPEGSLIPIEQRDPEEVYLVGNQRICPEGVEFYTPAFDVTPAHLIKGIITEFGVFPPERLEAGLAGHLNAEHQG